MKVVVSAISIQPELIHTLAPSQMEIEVETPAASIQAELVYPQMPIQAELVYTLTPLQTAVEVESPAASIQAELVYTLTAPQMAVEVECPVASWMETVTSPHSTKVLQVGAPECIPDVLLKMQEGHSPVPQTPTPPGQAEPVNTPEPNQSPVKVEVPVNTCASLMLKDMSSNYL